MKRILVCVLILSLAFLATGCAEHKEASPSPSVKPSEEPSPTIPSRELVFDENGNVILDEKGQIDGLAAIDGIDAFTTEEILKIAPYSDGALTTSVYFTLGRRLLKDFDETLSEIAEAEISEEQGGVEQLGYGLGYEIGLDLQSEVVTEEDCKVLYAEHDLTAPEQAVLDKIIEGFENARNS